MFSWLWGTVDFNLKYKNLWGETRAHGVPIHEENKKFKRRIYIIIPNISTPYGIRLTQVGVEVVCFLADCLNGTQIWPVVGSFFGWLINLWTSLSPIWSLEGTLFWVTTPFKTYSHLWRSGGWGGILDVLTDKLCHSCSITLLPTTLGPLS